MVVYVEGVRGLGGIPAFRTSSVTPLAMTQQVLPMLEKLLYTPDCGSSCGLAAGDRNRAVTRNTATAEGAH